MRLGGILLHLLEKSSTNTLSGSLDYMEKCVPVGALNTYPDPAVGDAWNPVFKLDNESETDLMGRPYILQWKMNVSQVLWSFQMT